MANQPPQQQGEIRSLQYIELSDFNAGIQSGIRGAATHTPAADGAAELSHTWGCVANPNGGLEAAPRLSYTKVYDITVDGDGFGTTTVPTGAPATVKLHDFVVTPSTNSIAMVKTAMPNTYQTREPDMVMIAYQKFLRFSAANSTTSGFVVADQNSDTITQYGNPSALVTLTFEEFIWGVMSITPIHTGLVRATGAPDATQPAYNSWLGALSVYRDDATTVTFSARNFTWPGVTDDFTTYIAYPNTTVQPMNTSGLDPAIRSDFHQGRWVYTSPHTGNTAGSGFQVENYGPFNQAVTPAVSPDALSDQKLVFYPINNVSGTPGSLTWGMHYNDGVGVMKSMNQNELFLITNAHGGVIIRDALETAQVTYYPGIESVGGYPNKGVVVPNLGLVYGTRGGVFAWNGGNQSVQLSKNLEGPFWVTSGGTSRTERDVRTSVGNFAYSHPYIFAPNNWIMDTRTGGWFRLHPTESQDSTGIDMSMFAIGSYGRIYGVQPYQRFSGANAGLMYNWFEPTKGATKYSWRSQPLARAMRGRANEYREVNVVASGGGSIEVTLLGTGGITMSKTFSVNSDTPQMFKLDFDVDAFDIQIQFLCNSGSTTVDAPRVLRCSIGYREANRPAKIVTPVAGVSPVWGYYDVDSYDTTVYYAT
jgi:hypothetical protein